MAPPTGSSVYLQQKRTSAQLESIYQSGRNSEMHVIGTFSYLGDEITFGTYVTPADPLGATLDRGYREAFEDARDSTAPTLVAHVPLYQQVDFASPGGQDYQKMKSQPGVSDSPSQPTQAEFDAVLQQANAEADAAAASEAGVTQAALPLASCKAWRPTYSRFKAGNHRMGWGNGYFYYGKVHTRFEWTGTQMRNLLKGCGGQSGWEQDFFMDTRSGTWIRKPLRSWSSNVPPLYVDTDFGDSGVQFGFGVVRAAYLKTNKPYYIVFTAPNGSDAQDKAGLVNDRTRPIPSSCFSKWCMFGAGRIDVRRGSNVPHYIDWLTIA